MQNLALDADTRTSITRAGGIGGLVRLLEEGSAVAQESAAGALGNLALSTDNRTVLVREGAVPLLVRLLGSQNDNTREAAAGAIENMAFDDSNCRLIADAGAVELLVAMLYEPSDSLKEAAAAALRRLSSNLDEVKVPSAPPTPLSSPPFARRIPCHPSDWPLVSTAAQLSVASTGGIALLVHLLRNGADAASADAAAVLEKISAGEEQMLAIARVGGLGELLSTIQKVLRFHACLDTGRDEWSRAGWAPDGVTESWHFAKDIHSTTSPAPSPFRVLPCAFQGNPEAIEAAARTIASCSKQSSAAIREMGGVSILLDLLQVPRLFPSSGIGPCRFRAPLLCPMTSSLLPRTETTPAARGRQGPSPTCA